MIVAIYWRIYELVIMNIDQVVRYGFVFIGGRINEYDECLLQVYIIFNLTSFKNQNIMVIYKLIASFLLITISLTTNTDIKDPSYTEDVQTFQKDNKRGCWFMARQYSQNKTIASKFYKLALIKQCMKKITRKQSVVKITSYVGKNMDKPKLYQDIVKVEDIPIFDHTIHPVDEYQVIEKEKYVSQYDKMILGYINSYQKDLEGINKGDQSAQLKKRLEEEINKRQKYYFGIIPANRFTSMLGLIAIAIGLVVLCTCWKRYQLRNKKQQQEKQNPGMKKSKVSKVIPSPQKKRN